MLESYRYIVVTVGDGFQQREREVIDLFCQNTLNLAYVQNRTTDTTMGYSVYHIKFLSLLTDRQPIQLAY